MNECQRWISMAHVFIWDSCLSIVLKKKKEKKEMECISMAFSADLKIP